MEREVYEEIGRCLEGSTPVVLATVAKAKGSTPRSPGATMVVRPDGSALGTIGGGCGEAEVWSVAMDVLATGLPRLVTVNLTEPIDGDDKICGGVMEVWLERIP